VDSYVIRSEFDAIDLIFEAPQSNCQVQFEGWPFIGVLLEPGDGRTTPEIIRAISIIEKQIYRLACHIKYGEPDLRRLTVRDRQQFKIQVEIGNGSTILGIDMSDAFNGLYQEAIKKINHITGLEAIFAVALLCSTSIFDSVLKYEAERDREFIRASTVVEVAQIQRNTQIEIEEVRKSVQIDMFREIVKLPIQTISAIRAFKKIYEEDSFVRTAFNKYPDVLAALLRTAPDGGAITINERKFETAVAKSIAQRVNRSGKSAKIIFENKEVIDRWTTETMKTVS